MANQITRAEREGTARKAANSHTLLLTPAEAELVAYALRRWAETYQAGITEGTPRNAPSMIEAWTLNRDTLHRVAELIHPRRKPMPPRRNQP